LQKLLFSVIAGIFLFGIIGNSQLVYGEKFVIDDNDFDLTGAFSEIFSFELFPGAYGGTGATVLDFTDEFEFDNWTCVTDGNGECIDNSPASIDLIGSDESGACPLSSIVMTSSRGVNAALFTDDECLTLFEIEVNCEGDIHFDWSFSTSDEDGPSLDPFAFHLNGVFTQLTDDDGTDSQSDTEWVAVTFGDIFGLAIDATDDTAGASTVTIDMLSAPWCLKNGNGNAVGGEIIPIEPTSLLLAGTQMTAAWLIPVIVVVIGIAIVIARKF